MHTWEWRDATRKYADQCADRFELLNGIRPQILDKKIMGDAGVKPINRFWYPFYVWDFVPEDAEYILVFDSIVLPARPLGELPDKLVFAAASDRHDRVLQGTNASPAAKKTGKYFQMMMFFAHRDTRPGFEAGKELQFDPKHIKNDGFGFDGRAHMTAMNEVIQSRYPVYELPKTWNWIIQYEKVFYTTEPVMINCGGPGTWAYWMYIKHLFERMEANGITP